MHEILEAADVDVKFGSLDTAIQNYELFLVHCDRHFADDDGIAVRVAASLREARELYGRREMNFERAALAQRSSKRNPDDTADSPALGDESLEQQLLMEFNDAIALSGHDPWSLAEQAERLASYYQEHGRHGTEERYREILWNLAQTRLLNTAFANSPDKLENLIICYEKNGNIKEKLCGNLSEASQWASERGYFELCDWLLRFEETDIVHALKEDVDETLKEIVSRHCATTLAYWAYGLEDQCVRDPAFRYLRSHHVLKKCIRELLFRPGTANRLKTLLDKGLEIPMDAFHEFLRTRDFKGVGSKFYTDRNRQGGDGGLSRAQEGALDDANEEDYKLRLLAENRDDIDVISGRSNALHISTKCGDLTAVRLLLQLGADPSYSENDLFHWTALHMAARWGFPEIATVLLDAGSDVNVKAGGYSPLCEVTRFGNDEHAERLTHLLLERGADPNVKVGQIQQTPLHMVAAYSDEVWSVSVAKALVDAGADIEATDREGNTALRVAAKHKNQTIVDLLLERGADPSTQRGAVALFKSLSSRLSNKLSRGS
jgi:ankyrin repeat protein